MADTKSAFFLGIDPILGNDGLPLIGGKLKFLEAGSTTVLQDVYTDTLGTVSVNPVITDSAGRALIYGQASPYTVQCYDANDVLQWTIPSYYFPVVGDAFDGLVTASGLRLTELVDSNYSGSPSGTVIYTVTGAGSGVLGYSALVFDETANLKIGGLNLATGVGNPTAVFWINKSDFTLTWVHNFTPSASNNIYCANSIDLVAHKNDCGWLYWDASTFVWRVMMGGATNYFQSTYVPTLTATANCSALSLSAATYTVSGREVTVDVSGTATITSANVLTTFTISNPVVGVVAPPSTGHAIFSSTKDPGSVVSGTTTSTVSLSAANCTTNGAAQAWSASWTYRTS